MGHSVLQIHISSLFVVVFFFSEKKETEKKQQDNISFELSAMLSYFLLKII